MTRLRPGSQLTALALTTLLASPALGQDLGREGTLSYGVGLDYDFDEGLEVISDVGLTLITRTRSQVLEFGIGTELVGDFTDGGTDDFDFRDSFASVGYTVNGANSTLALSASYTERNLEDEVIGSIISDGGTETASEFNGRYEFGAEGPFGLTLDARFRERAFENADPDLTDDRLVSLDALARFSLSRSMDLRALAGIQVEKDQDAAGSETETSYVGLGLATQTAGGLSFTGDVFFDQTETTTTTPVSSVSEDGIGFSLAATQVRPDGFIAGTLTSRIDDAGRRTRAEVTRSFTTKTGELEVSLGVVDQEGSDDLQLVGSVAYSIETPRSTFTVALEQDASTDDGDTVVDTSLELGYRREINAVSGWEADLGYFATDELNGDDDNRTTASLAYTRDLTDEWSMRTGYAYSKDDGSDASNSVFFTLQRDITFGF